MTVKKLILAVAALTIFWVVVLVALGSVPPEPPPRPAPIPTPTLPAPEPIPDPLTQSLEAELFVRAQGAIRSQLKAPSTAKFPWSQSEVIFTKIGYGVYGVESWVEAQNSFGVPLRTRYLVVFRCAGGNITLLSAQLQEP